MVKKKGVREGDVGNADGQRPLAASVVVAVGNADAGKERERPVRGDVPPRAVRKGFVEEVNEKQRDMASKAALTASTSYQKKPRASSGGQEAPKSIHAG